jgi:hypothetical protein
MSIQEQSPDSSAPTAEQGGELAQVAAQQASKVASSVGESTKQVAGEAAAQASAVVGQAKEQIQSLVGQTKGELDAQLSSKGEQMAGGLRNLAGQLDALAQGRPTEAGPLTGYVQEARSKVDGFVRRLDEAGPQGLMSDLASFARRRPGAFLAGAAVLGFVVGRAVRAGTAASKEGLVGDGSSARPPIAVGSGMGGELPPPSTDELLLSGIGSGSGPSTPSSAGPGLA